MSVFDALTLLGGICLFLFGMSVMGQALERAAGSKLRSILSKLTTNPVAGFLTGCGVTCIVQSSAVTVVMVVGFVNSSLMDLSQATNVIIGANVGTTITGWILSLTGIKGSGWVQLLQPTSFTPVIAVIGIVLYMFCKRNRQKDAGMILLGFATLMFGMSTMSNAVSGLKDVPAFRELFIKFENPILGLLVGIALTALIQSSSASVGILQALSMTGQISYAAAVPIVIGAGIGATVPSLVSCIGAKKDAQRAAFINLIFNVVGAVFWLIIFYGVKIIFKPAIISHASDPVSIAIINTAFRLLSTLLVMPNTKLMNKLVCRIIPDSNKEEPRVVMDERLLATPPLALQQCRTVALDMAICAVRSLKNALEMFEEFSPEKAERIRSDEDICDYYEDILGTYLIKLSAERMGQRDAGESTELLKIIGDFERISDHAVNILESAEEMRDKKLTFTEDAQKELKVISAAVYEIVQLSYKAFDRGDLETASCVEPLEELIDCLKEQMRTRHILRMQGGNCSIEAGFIWSDLLTNLERTSDHCSNIAGCVLDGAHQNFNLHQVLKDTKVNNSDYEEKFRAYSAKYVL